MDTGGGEREKPDSRSDGSVCVGSRTVQSKEELQTLRLEEEKRRLEAELELLQRQQEADKRRYEQQVDTLKREQEGLQQSYQNLNHENHRLRQDAQNSKEQLTPSSAYAEDIIEAHYKEVEKNKRRGQLRELEVDNDI